LRRGRCPDDYSAAASAENVDPLAELAVLKGPKLLVVTLTDDNIAVQPQYVGQPTQTLIRAAAESGLDGFMVRCFMFGEMDPGTDYLSKIAWSLEAKHNDALAQRIERICGPGSVGHALKAFDQLDELTASSLVWSAFGFPVPNMLALYYDGKAKPSPHIPEITERYESIGALLRSAHEASEPHGRDYLDYFVRRTQFAIEMLQVLDPVTEAGRAHRRFLELRKNFRCTKPTPNRSV